MKANKAILGEISLKGFDPMDAPFVPIRREWECLPIVKAIRAAERKLNLKYTLIRPA